MENKEIMERLLQDDNNLQSTVKNKPTATKSYEDWEIQVSKVRVVTAKYKVYIALLLLFIAILLLTYIPRIKWDLESSRSAYEQANSQLSSIEIGIKAAEVDMNYLCNDTEWIISNAEALKDCLNNREWCSSLPELWKTWPEEDRHYDLSIPLSYLQVNSLYSKKMSVDEKMVLRNLNEYLIKQDISWNDRRRVWDILRINIWEAESVEWWNDHFFRVPLDVQIKFDTIGDLTWFLYNVEKKMIDNSEDRILYKIQSVSYDIVTNDEPQNLNNFLNFFHQKDLMVKKNALMEMLILK